MDELVRLTERLTTPTDYLSGTTSRFGGVLRDVLVFGRLTSEDAMQGGRISFHPRHAVALCLRTPGVVQVRETSHPLAVGEALLLAPYSHHRYESFEAERLCWLFVTFAVVQPCPKPYVTNQVFVVDATGLSYLQELLAAWLGGREQDVTPWLMLFLNRHCVGEPRTASEAGLAAPAAPKGVGPTARADSGVNGTRDRSILRALPWVLGIRPSASAPGGMPRFALPLRDEIQVEKACGLLLDSEMTVGDIAYRCGFSSQSAFNRRFRTETGETPLGYRTKIRQSPDIAYHGLETR